MENKLRPEIQKMFDELKAKKDDDNLIYTVFMKAQSLGLNDFEAMVLLANIATEQFNALKKSYLTYMQNDVRPIVIPNDVKMKDIK